MLYSNNTYAILVEVVGLGSYEENQQIQFNIKDINKRFENKNFEYILSNLTLELVTAKLELSANSLRKTLWISIYKNMQHIVKESLVRFSLRFCNSQKKQQTY